MYQHFLCFHETVEYHCPLPSPPSLPPSCLSACGLNVHKRCERMVPHNCGVNQKELAIALKEMGVTPDKLKPKSSIVSCRAPLGVHIHVRIAQHTLATPSSMFGNSCALQCTTHMDVVALLCQLVHTRLLLSCVYNLANKVCTCLLNNM